jgi:hypothetical protein
MKALTHYIFSAGASLYALSAFGQLSWYSVALALWLSLSINYVIDALGHSIVGTPSRTRLTHSIFTAPLWGAVISSISVCIFSRAVSSGPELAALGFWTTAGILIALGHLFLDSMTQAGVYYWRNRMAIVHFKYDNLALNTAFILAGLGLTFLAILQSTPPSPIPPIALSFVENFVIIA